MRGRSGREQALIAFLGGIVIVAILWLAVLRPLLDARATAISRISAYEDVMVRVRTAGPTGPVTAALVGPLESAIPTQAATFGVIPTVNADNDAADVTVSEGRYESVIPWLASLEASGATLSSVRITRGSLPGAVNVTLRVQT
jgi:general secretion pathway protein M